MAATVSKLYIILTFAHAKVYVNKFDLGVKYVKVNQGS